MFGLLQRLSASAWKSGRGNGFLGWSTETIALGLPEWDDRLDLWRIALVHENSRRQPLGEVHIDADGNIRQEPDPSMVVERLRSIKPEPIQQRNGRRTISLPPTPNKLILGDCRAVLSDFPPASAQLVFTSPPYFNAKPQCTEYLDYESYLRFLGEAFDACHAVLAEGRFLIVNVSPVLVRRTSRSTASQRLPIPFDIHPILDRGGFEFIDTSFGVSRKERAGTWGVGGVLRRTDSRSNTSRSPSQSPSWSTGKDGSSH